MTAKRATGWIVGLLVLFLAGAGAVSAQTPDVRTAQARLTILGYEPGPPDGVVGQRTRDAVRAFQADRGLPISGEIDPPTERTLALAAAERSPQPTAAQPLPAGSFASAVAGSSGGQRAGRALSIMPPPRSAPTPRIVERSVLPPPGSSPPAVVPALSASLEAEIDAPADRPPPVAVIAAPAWEPDRAPRREAAPPPVANIFARTPVGAVTGHAVPSSLWWWIAAGVVAILMVARMLPRDR
jgi:peptidoglycan hydrolase-like protein with peptidoglycan-binding domain